VQLPSLVDTSVTIAMSDSALFHSECRNMAMTTIKRQMKRDDLQEAGLSHLSPALQFHSDPHNASSDCFSPGGSRHSPSSGTTDVPSWLVRRPE
jgi:hypothetical protein